MPITPIIDAAVVTKIIAQVVRKESKTGNSLDLLRAEVIDGKAQPLLIYSEASKKKADGAA